jgi:hypothetical protein
MSMYSLLHVSVHLDHPQGDYAEPCQSYTFIDLECRATARCTALSTHTHHSLKHMLPQHCTALSTHTYHSLKHMLPQHCTALSTHKHHSLKHMLPHTTLHGTQYTHINTHTHHSLKPMLPQHCTALSTHTTAWNTCCHNAARHSVHTPQSETHVATTLHGTQYTHHSLKHMLPQRCTALSTHTTTWNTCCHNTARHSGHTPQTETHVATTLHGTQYTHHDLKHMFPQHCKNLSRCTFTD